MIQSNMGVMQYITRSKNEYGSEPQLNGPCRRQNALTNLRYTVMQVCRCA